MKMTNIETALETLQQMSIFDMIPLNDCERRHKARL